MKRALFLVFTAMLAVVAISSCNEEELQNLQQQIDELKSNQIASIDTQISGIWVSIGNMETTDAELRNYISALQDQQAALQAIDQTLSSDISALRAELSANISVVETNVLAQLEAYRATIAAQLNSLSEAISTLQAKDTDLQQQISDLKTYAEGLNSGTRDWASATFVTLEQYNQTAGIVATIQAQITSINSEIAQLKQNTGLTNADLTAAISGLRSELQPKIQKVADDASAALTAATESITAAYTTAIANAISASETSMKSWINSQLTAYYTAAQTDAKIAALKSNLEGQLNSQKAYVEGLLNTLETTLNTKIAANKTLIDGLQNQINGINTEVATLSGKVASNTTAISTNAAQISANASAIAQNASDIDACEALIAANKTLIQENASAIAANATAISALHARATADEQSISANATAIAKNASDIAANAELIATNATAISNNAAAIADNAAAIVQLRADLNTAKSDITAAYQAAITSAITALNGTLSGELATQVTTINTRIDTEIAAVNSTIDALTARVTQCEKDIKNIKNTIYAMQQDIETLQDQVSAILARIQSITYVPKYADGRAVMTYTDNGTLTPGAAVFDFELKPASTAAELVKVWQEALSMKAVYTITRAPETVNLTISSATAENGYLTVTVSGAGLKNEFFRSQCAANVRLCVSDGNNDLTTDYIRMIPWTTDIITFADANFKAACMAEFDANGDGEITAEEAEAATTLTASMLNIESLTGIEYFKNLTSLDVSFNKLTSLDLSRLTKLTNIQVNGNKLQTLDLTGLSELTSLDCSNNKLSTLDVSDAEDLQTLICSNNQIGALDLRNNKLLEDLQCSTNSLSALNLKNNTKLTTLLCRKNALTTLDVTKLPLLVNLDCSVNTLASLNVYNNPKLETLYCASTGLATLGVTANTALTVLDCSGNALTALDVTKNALLETLNCSNNDLSRLDVSKNTALETLNCQSNVSLAKLWVKDAAHEAALTIKKDNVTNIFYNNGSIIIPDANLKAYLVANFDEDFDGEISIEEAEKITMVNCSGKSITDLTGLEVCTNLEYVNCANNTISTIDFHTLNKLKTLICYDNTLSSINLDNCSELTGFYISDVSTNSYSVEEQGAAISIQGYAQATSLAFSMNVIPYRVAIYGSTVLETLDLTGCQCVSVVTNENTAMTAVSVDPSLEEYFGHGCTSLASIDVSHCQSLRILQVYDNALAALDVTHNPELVSLQAQNNHINTIDLTQNPELVSVILSNNNLSAINVQNNLLLEKLDVGHNNLSAVNVTKNAALKELKVNNNAGITIMNVANNPALRLLNIRSTAITQLDLSNNELLYVLLHDNGVTIIGYKYKIGSIYEIGGVECVVCVCDSSGVRVMTLDETTSKWRNSTESASARNDDDGADNMATIKALGISGFPAFKWCDDKGEGWYLPAKNEMKAIYDNRTIIDSALSKYGATLLGTKEYWTSCDDGAAGAFTVNFATGVVTQSSKYKTHTHYVRAIKLITP